MSGNVSKELRPGGGGLPDGTNIRLCMRLAPEDALVCPKRMSVVYWVNECKCMAQQSCDNTRKSLQSKQKLGMICVHDDVGEDAGGGTDDRAAGDAECCGEPPGGALPRGMMMVRSSVSKKEGIYVRETDVQKRKQKRGCGRPDDCMGVGYKGGSGSVSCGSQSFDPECDATREAC